MKSKIEFIKVMECCVNVDSINEYLLYCETFYSQY